MTASHLTEPPPPSLESAVTDVSVFHLATGTPVLFVPRFPEDDRVDLRVSLIVEEVTKELLPAIARRDLVETADAMVDSIYVIIGAALEFGIPIEQVWAAVQAANMAKAPGGRVVRRHDGKILKPEGWQPPDVLGILRRAGYEP